MSAAAGIDDAAFSMHESGASDRDEASDDSEEDGASDDDEAAGRILEAADRVDDDDEAASAVEAVGALSRLEAAGWRPDTDDHAIICYGRIIDGVPRIEGPAGVILRLGPQRQRSTLRAVGIDLPARQP